MRGQARKRRVHTKGRRVFTEDPREKRNGASGSAVFGFSVALCETSVAFGADPALPVPHGPTITGWRNALRCPALRLPLSQIPYNDLNAVEIELPPRQPDTGYKHPKLSSQRFVPEIY